MDSESGSELKQFYAYLTSQIADLGTHGWEAVGQVSVSDSKGQTWPQLLFKRPKG